MSQVYKYAAEIQAARIACEAPEMDAVAEHVADLARALAASHNVTGEYIDGIGTAEIKGKRGVIDRIAYVDHTFAASIEFGHVQTPHKGSRFIGPPRFVEGLHIMGRAAAQA